MLDSISFRKQKQMCELAEKVADYLERNAPEDSYDFALPDLIYFEDELILSELRDEAKWKALESQFIAHKGMIVEPDSEPVEPKEKEEVAEKPLVRLRVINPWRIAFQCLLALSMMSTFAAYKIGENHGQQTQVIGATTDERPCKSIYWQV